MSPSGTSGRATASILQGGGFGRRVLEPDLALGIGVAVGDGCLTRSTIAGREQLTVILTMHAAEAGVLGAVASAVTVEKAALKAVGSVGRNDGVVRDARRLGLSARLRLPAGGGRVPPARRPRRGLRGQAVHPRGVRAGPALAGRGAPRALHRRRDGGELRREVAVRGARLAPRRPSSGRSSSCCSPSASSPSSTGIAAARTTVALLPDGKGGRREYPVAPMFSLRISRSSRFVFEREIGFHRREPEGRRAGATERGDRHLPRRAHRRRGVDRAARRGRRLRPHRGRHASLRGGRPRRPQLLRVHVPRRHRLQPGLDQPRQVPRPDGELRRRGLSARLPALDDRARDQRAHGGLPEPAHRRAELPLPHARPRLRQPGHGADAPGHPLRLPQAVAICGRDHRDHARRGVRRPRRRWPRTWARSPAMRGTARPCCG